MQINPGLSLFQISDAQLQIGSGYRAVAVRQMTPPIAAFIAALRRGIVDGQELEVATQCDLTQQQANELLAALQPVLMFTPTREHFVLSQDQDHRGSLARLNSVSPWVEQGKLRGLTAHDRQRFEDLRHGAALQIFGLGRTGTALTRILLESGIGHLSVWDAGRTTTADLGTGLTDRDIGQVRSLAVARSLNPPHRRPVLHPVGWLRQPEFSGLATIHFMLGGLDADSVVQAKDRRHPYLPVVIRDDEVDIGPWVVPQATVCPLCVYRGTPKYRAMTGKRVRALAQSTGGVETIAGAHLVAGIAATEVLAMIDSQILRMTIPHTGHGEVPGIRVDTFTKVQLAHGWVQTFVVEPLPGCCAMFHEPRIVKTS